MSGFSDFGAALGSVGQSRANAYQTGMYRQAQASDVLEQARERRDKNVAMAAITPQTFTDYQGSPGGAGGAEAQAIFARAGINPSEYANANATNFGVQQKINNLAALDAGGSIESLNPRMAIVKGDPLKLSSIEGDTLLNPYATPDQNRASAGYGATDVGQAHIIEYGAAANAHNASAGASAASAARQMAGITADRAGNYDEIETADGVLRHNKLTNEVTPITYNGQNVQKQGNITPTLPPEGILGALVGKNNSGAAGVATPSPLGMQQFLTWQQKKAETDPRYNNGSYAAARYAAEAPYGSSLAVQMPGKPGHQLVISQPTVAPNNNPQDFNDALGISRPKSDVADVVKTNAPVSAAQQVNSGITAGTPAIIANGRATQAVDPSAPMTVLQPGQEPGGMARPTTQAAFNALPKGAQFINPSDGTVRTKN